MADRERREIGEVRDKIICGDVLEVLGKIPRDSVHLLITSPPYNLEKQYEQNSDALEDTEYLNWMGRVWSAAADVLVPSGRICVNIGENKRQNITYPTYGAFVLQLGQLGLLYDGMAIWNKNSAAKHCAWGSWKSCSNPHIVPRHEYIIVYAKETRSVPTGGEKPDVTEEELEDWSQNMWTFGTESKKRLGHPAPFPTTLPERLIKMFSVRGQVVMDPFAGSGTVGVAAVRLGRHFILADNSRRYCGLAKERIDSEGTLFLQTEIVPVESL